MEGNIKSIVLGGGCFWCSEAVFSMIDGVVNVTSGYAGGHTANPTYEEVCTDSTGHAEVVRIEYDATKVDLIRLLEIFFEMHDPTSINRQGEDVGTQYRSIILYDNDSDREIVEDYVNRIRANYGKEIVTEIKRLDKFYEAENYHKDYYKNHKFESYPLFVIAPKIKKIEKEFQNSIKQNRS
ncbi:MAG: peptide-methionine (S)-S-oxide reductase MsrA [Candidatus Thermoplasmatota archaeon]|nr:peptide-methionine (S)-S-oxide reductase MsrA [Candidatus Thermoplasmatota archaeon]